jgi:very-short-patch-repair endonuclease
MTRYHNRTTEKTLRRELRNSMPKAEVVLWGKLKSRQLLGCKFRRQFSVGPYIVDFYCPALKLALEVDGDSHFHDGAKKYDAKRQAYIESLGIKIVRFLNTEIYENIEGVLQTLMREMTSQLHVVAHSTEGQMRQVKRKV